MTTRSTLYEELRCQGVWRRGFLKFCGYMSSLMALPVGGAEAIAQGTQHQAPAERDLAFCARMHGL